MPYLYADISDFFEKKKQSRLILSSLYQESYLNCTCSSDGNFIHCLWVSHQMEMFNLDSWQKLHVSSPHIYTLNVSRKDSV